MKFFIFKTKQLPLTAQKSLLPRKEFVTQGKERFLAAFDASALAMNAHSARRPYGAIFLKIGIGVMAALCVAVAVSAYADTANVSATNPLYPLKRLSEDVQLALTPAPEKAQLQARFAVRRADEIAALQASAPSSTLIPKLIHDLNKEIGDSLGTSVNGGGNENKNGNGNSLNNGDNAGNTIIATSSDAGPVNIYCKAFNVSTSGVFIGSLENDLALHPEALARFNEQCGSESHGNTDSGSIIKESSGFIDQSAHGHSNPNIDSNTTSNTSLNSTNTLPFRIDGTAAR